MKKNRLLLLVILLLGVGFATVATTLYLNGNVKIATNNEDFDVKFTKAIIDDTDVSSTAISEDGKTITFSTKDLSMVNDTSKLDFEITNNSAMYDVSVNVELTVNGAKKDYYEITKEVPTPIAGKRTEKGNVQVKLLKASVNDIEETFTLTLTATAVERTEKAEKLKYRPKYYDVGLGYVDISTTSSEDYTTLTYPEGISAAGQPAKVFAGLDTDNNKSVCILYNGKLECFKNKKYAETKEHLLEAFGETNCAIKSSGNEVYCNVSGLSCNTKNYIGSPSFGCADTDSTFYCMFDSKNIGCGQGNLY